MSAYCGGPDDPALFTNLNFYGKATFEDGTHVPVQQMNVSVVLEGEDFFVDSANERCRVLDHHMSAGQNFTSVIEEGAYYEANTNFESLHALVDSECPVAPSLPKTSILNLLLDVSIPADSDNCSAFCKASRPNQDFNECVNSCLEGDRLISAHASFNTATLVEKANETGGDVIFLLADLVFYDLSEPIANVNGPDLRVDARAAQNTMFIDYQSFDSESCAVFEGCIRGTGQRKLLRFDGIIQNLGDEDFVLGAPWDEPDLYTYSACHGHYHLREAMAYELLHKDTLEPVILNGEAVVGHKQGFCMIDMRKISSSAGPATYTCEFQGLSSGWADVYSSGLDCQWIDVTGVPAGDYYVRITVNPGGSLYEADVHNNSAIVPYTIE